MTKEEAIKIIQERIQIDREMIDNLNPNEFDEFLKEQDEALRIALECMR